MFDTLKVTLCPDLCIELIIIEIHEKNTFSIGDYAILKEEKDLDWTFFSPALEMHPGINTGRTGNYRLGKDSPVFDENGKSQISAQDVSVVIADEIENPKHNRARFTAAY